MLNSFRSVERRTVYSYLTATITTMITGQTQFESEYLLDELDGRSSHAVLHVGRVYKNDMVIFNLDSHARQALGKVQGFVQDGGCLFVHLLQFQPCSLDCNVRWDASQHEEAIVISHKIIQPVTYKFATANTIRIIVPVIL